MWANHVRPGHSYHNHQSACRSRRRPSRSKALLFISHNYTFEPQMLFMYTYFCIACLPASLIVVVVVITAVQNRINGVQGLSSIIHLGTHLSINQSQPNTPKNYGNLF